MRDFSILSFVMYIAPFIIGFVIAWSTAKSDIKYLKDGFSDVKIDMKKLQEKVDKIYYHYFKE